MKDLSKAEFQERIYNSRIERMGKLIQLKAPRVVLLVAAELIIRSVVGCGRWGAAWYMFCSAWSGLVGSIRFSLWYFWQKHIKRLTEDEINVLIEESL